MERQGKFEGWSERFCEFVNKSDDEIDTIYVVERN